MTDDRAQPAPDDDRASADDTDAIIAAAFERGKRAFEGGQYRGAIAALESATARVNPLSAWGGEIQLFLVSAYEGGGDRQSAQTLCRTLTRHPDLETRDLAKRLLYVLEAPVLKTRPEWIVEIPDLAAAEASDERLQRGGSTTPRQPPEPQPWIPEPVDPSLVNLHDNRFIGVALLAVALLGIAIALSI